MKTLAVNDNIDIYLGDDGNLAMVSDLDAVLQGCEQEARIRLGELPYAQSQGIPFFESVFTDSPDLGLYEMYLRRQFARVDNVVKVQSIAFNIDGNTLAYEAIIITTFGPGVARGSL